TICASLNLDFFMQRPPWGGFSTFEWREDSRRLHQSQAVKERSKGAGKAPAAVGPALENHP
ncbi:hypothetical protein, partial [Comamonas guangdongensis]